MACRINAAFLGLCGRALRLIYLTDSLGFRLHPCLFLVRPVVCHRIRCAGLMKSTWLRGLVALLALGVQLHFGAAPLMAETNQNEALRWLAKTALAPAFVPPDSKAAWENHRQEIRAEVWRLLGQLPPRPTVPHVTRLEREDRGEYLLEKFWFANDAGADVPGYLLLPKRASGKVPGLLYCHWHGGEYDIGKEELFQSSHTPEAPGPALVKQGFAVMAIDAYCFGERNGHGPGGPAERGGAGELTASKFNLWVGRTLWGMMLRDDLIALDYLAARPEVDTNRLAVMGMSMGATRTWWLMALDDRLKKGVAVCCLTRYRDLIEHGELKAHGIYYYVPNILNHFDTEAIVALLAPRPILFLDGDRDSTSPVDGIHAIEAAVRPVYRLYGQENNFQSLVYPNQGHLYTPEMWKRTMAWLCSDNW
jgi:dienelactone hydrolase